MSDVILRLGVLALLSLVVWGAVWAGRGYVEVRRRRALAAAPAPTLDHLWASSGDTSKHPSGVSILAFSSQDCVQCHRLQAPALRRVVEARGDAVRVVEVDAPSTPDLTERYNVLTVPATVVLDAAGRARAVNYGFANVRKLLGQVDDVLGVVGTAEAGATPAPGGAGLN